MKNKQIIVIDDDVAMKEMVEDFLQSKKVPCQSFSLASRAFEWLQTQDLEPIQAIVTDQNMPEMDGVEFVQRMQKLNPDIPVIIMTAYASIDSAIEATRLGAFAYISKPFKLTEFDVTLQKAMHLRELKKENQTLRQSIRGGWKFGQIIGKSRVMTEVFHTIEKVAPAQSTVLIKGDSGTGKELVARAIHDNSRRKDQPFVAINCTAIPENLLESELFGHVKGSFTGAVSDKKGLFEEAQGGTLFLDEIGDLDMSLQAKLLRVLQEKTIKPVGANKEKKVDVRVITATHKNLQKAIEEELFREDLYYRLSVLPIQLPPLRQRREDIPLLANFFLEKYAALNQSRAKSFSAEAMNELLNYPWNGNVRELENVVERLTVMSSEEVIHKTQLDPTPLDNTSADFFLMATQDWPTIDELNRRYIDVVLEKTGGRKEKAAQILGINRRTLYRREKEAQITSETHEH
jgi:two-component system response regulator HydG